MLLKREREKQNDKKREREREKKLHSREFAKELTKYGKESTGTRERRWCEESTKESVHRGE